MINIELEGKKNSESFLLWLQLRTTAMKPKVIKSPNMKRIEIMNLITDKIHADYIRRLISPFFD